MMSGERCRPPVRMTAEARANAALRLRAVLAAIYAGRVDVTAVQRAYVAGLLDGLEGRLENVPGMRGADDEDLA